jgi:C1A family cysteine protease
MRRRLVTLSFVLLPVVLLITLLPSSASSGVSPLQPSAPNSPSIRDRSVAPVHRAYFGSSAQSLPSSLAVVSTALPTPAAHPADGPLPSSGQFVRKRAPTRPLPKRPLPPGTGFIPSPIDLSHLKGDRLPEGVRAAALPSSFDWRREGIITRVQDQNPCGACYAFGFLANFESKLQIDGAGTFDFSENMAKECNWEELNNFQDPPGSPWGGCQGGNPFMMASLFSTKGAVLESCDPYVPRDDVPCKTTCPYQKTILDWRLINGNLLPDPDVLKGYIQTYGPATVSMYAGDDDAWYREFSRYDGSYTLYHPGTESTNHCVAIVGWDDNLVHDGGRGGWIVKNSWGTDWGGTCGYGNERGYFTIAYGSAALAHMLLSSMRGRTTMPAVVSCTTMTRASMMPRGGKAAPLTGGWPSSFPPAMPTSPGWSSGRLTKQRTWTCTSTMTSMGTIRATYCGAERIYPSARRGTMGCL